MFGIDKYVSLREAAAILRLILFYLPHASRTNGHIVQKITHEELSYPQGITFDPERKELFVSDKWKHCIFVFSQEGQLLRKLCTKGDQAGQLRSPEGIAFCTGDCLFVCDTGNDRIQVSVMVEIM